MTLGTRAGGRSTPSVWPPRVPPIAVASAAPRPRRGASIPGLTLAAQPMGGICGAARKASRRQRAPPGASGAGSCGGSPWEAARLRARAGERTSRCRLRTPRPPRPGCRPAGEGRGRAGAAGRVALSQSRARAPPSLREHARPLTDFRRGRGADPGTGCTGFLRGNKPGTRRGPCHPDCLADIRALAFDGLAFRYSRGWVVAGGPF